MIQSNKFLLWGILCAMLPFVTHAQLTDAGEVEISAWPTSMPEFQALQKKLNGTPEGSTALLLVAFKMYVQNQTLGEHALTMVVHPDLLVVSETGYEGYGLRASDLQLLKLQLRHRTINSYISGANSKDDYALPKVGPYVIVVRKSEAHKDDKAHRTRRFVVSAGSDTSRPVMLHREPANSSGLWYVQDWSALLMPVR